MEDGVVSDESLLRATRRSTRSAKSKSKSKSKPTDDDIDDATPDADAATTTAEESLVDEFSIMKDFCKWKATWKDFTEQITSETADLRARNRQLRDDLFAAMRSARLSITYLPEAAVRTDDLPRFVRINKTTSTRVVNIETVKEIIDEISVDEIREQLSEGKTFSNAVLECILNKLKNTCTNQRLTVQLTSTAERGTNVLEVPKAPREIEALAIALHESTRELRELAETKKKELEEIESHLEDLEPRMEDLLDRQSWKTKRIRLETGVKEPREYILRKRETISKGSWKLKDLKILLPEILEKRLSKYDHFNKKFVEDLKSTLESFWDTREPKTKKSVCLDRCAERWN